MVKSCVSVADSLVWELTKKQNCFLHKNKSGHKFSRNKMNLRGLHTYSNSGLTSKAVGLQQKWRKAGDKADRSEKVDTVVMYTRSKNGGVVETQLRRNTKRAVKSINAATKDRFYRSDLNEDALRKLGKINWGRKSSGKWYQTAQPTRRTRKDDEDDEE